MTKRIWIATPFVAIGALATISFCARTLAQTPTSRPAGGGPVAPAPKLADSTPTFPEDLMVWPNKTSHANSDAWLVENHDKLRKMRPRVLVLNFCNGFAQEKAEKMAKQLATAVTEGTRYHGYADPKVEPFIEWQVLRIVDLRDTDPNAQTPDGNSTKYPRSGRTRGSNLAYKEFYSPQFAEYLGYQNPEHPGTYLKLNELVERGIIQEMWFFAYQRSAGAPFECTELKPVYDENFKRLGDQHKPSGNGGDREEPWFGRSLRISFINAERGIGCNVESLSHSMEATANSSVIPYYRKYFYEYAGFDLDKRWKLPFDRLYAVGGHPGDGISYPDDHTMVIKLNGKEYRVENYYCIGGNVHWMPNGRSQYDLDSPFPVLSTIEHYRLHDGPDGQDMQEPWTIDKKAKYKDMAPDCMGQFLIYWRQNMPGLDNHCKDDDGKPMKNWWPFLFY